MQSCEPCATAYAEFRTTIEALHELPKARMPHVVHLPSTAPVAERSPEHRLGWSRLNLGLLRRFPATALAGGFAVVLLIVALVHGVGGSSVADVLAAEHCFLAAARGDSRGLHARVRAHRRRGAACQLHPGGPGHRRCPAGAPPGARRADAAGDARPAGVRLRAVLGARPGDRGPRRCRRRARPRARCSHAYRSRWAPRRTYRPSRRVPERVQTPVAAPGANAGGPGLELGGSAGPLLYFQVPPGLAPGTEIHVIATIPANFTAPGSPPLTAELTLTTR